MVAFYFAIALSAITVVGDLGLYAATGRDASLPIAFLCFLPLAFMFIGQHVVALKKEIDCLKDQVAELQQHSSSG